MKQIHQKATFVFYTLIWLPSLLLGQWTTQTLTLQPGWNAVYLEVDPLPRECSTIFNGIDIESVWATTAQFELDNPDLDWWTYYPIGSSQTSTLFTLQGGKTYSINYLGTTPIDIALSGKPILNELTWQADTYREAGFHIDATNAPTFADFLANETAFGSNDIERMNTNGDWVAIADPNTETINKGEAYRLKTDEPSTYVSPFTIELEQNNSLDFGQILLEQLVRIKNHSNNLKQISIAALASEDNIFAPYNLAGEVALNYWDTDNEEWVDLSTGLSLDVSANEEVLLRIAIDRLQMPFSSHGLYQSLLEFKDNEGTALLVPASGFGLLNRTGLWVGTAIINEVNDVNIVSTNPQATASEFVIKLIVHVDDTGQARLLDQVIQMWHDGTYKADPADPSHQIVDVPGQYILITDDDLLPLYSGAAIRDGKEIGRRISSAFFSLDEPQLLTGIFDGTLEETLMLDYNDPLNPFKHTYHPDHNNMDERNENVLPEGVESYNVQRNIQLAFSINDPDNLSFAGFGDNQAGGTYIEAIKGLHKDELYVRGTFRLQRVSTIGKLNEPSNVQQIQLRKPQPRKFTPIVNNLLNSSETIESKQEIPIAQIYPNPVKSNFQIIGLEEGNYTLSIRDFSGKTILHQNFYSGEAINIQQLIPGIYTLEVRSPEWVQNIKFIKQSL